MDVLLEWAGYLARWGHVIAAITWVGTSFYFNWLDLSERPPEARTLKPNVQGTVHEMHGGSFYYHERYWPNEPATRLLNHSGPAQLTLVTGLLLIFLIYWFQAKVYLVGSSSALPEMTAVALSAAMLVLPFLAYHLLCRQTANDRVILGFAALLVLGAGYVGAQVFSPRAAVVHVGAMLGMIMALNVVFVIVPNHIKMNGAVRNGQEVDLDHYRQAKRRSQHNNYFTLPVLFAMLAVHFPLVSANGWGFLTLFFVMGGLFLFRRARNVRLSTGAKDRRIQALAVLFLAAGIGLSFIPATGTVQDMAALTDDRERRIFEITQARCTVCHAASPTMDGFTAAPAGLMLETMGQIAEAKDRIYTQAVATDIMPPGNITELTDAERAELGAWLQEIGARIMEE